MSTILVGFLTVSWLFLRVSRSKERQRVSCNGRVPATPVLDISSPCSIVCTSSTTEFELSLTDIRKELTHVARACAAAATGRHGCLAAFM